MDRRRHARYAVSGRADVLTLHDVDIEAASATELTVLAASPSARGAETMMCVTGSRDRTATLRVRTMRCVPELATGHRRYRITYAVVADRPPGS